MIIDSKTLTMESTLHDAMMEVNDDSLFVLFGSATGILLEVVHRGRGGDPLVLTVNSAKEDKLKWLLDLTSGVNQFVVEVKPKPPLDPREKVIDF